MRRKGKGFTEGRGRGTNDRQRKREERQEKAGSSRGARRKEARGRHSFCPCQCQESSLRVLTFPSTKYWPLLSLGIWRQKQLMRLTRWHAVTQAQMVPMFLYNPLVHPIKQTITPWQIHFNKAPRYYRAQRLPGDESHCRCGQATAPTQLSSTVPSAEWLRSHRAGKDCQEFQKFRGW